jgi:LPS O-antigen subunit length determinant protein (WzzB/FepE family)
MKNLKELIETQINPIINIQATKDMANDIKGQNLHTFEKSLIYATNVLKLRNLLKDSNFKQISKTTFDIQFTKIEDAMELILGIKKAWYSRLCSVSEQSTNDTLKAYKKAQNDIASEKGKIPTFSIDSYYNFLNAKEGKEDKEETKEQKIEKVKKLIEKLGLPIEDIK